jgi:peptidyl-tRNA hydrolase
MGIGRPEIPGQDPADFVLEPLTGGEKEEFKKMIEEHVEALEVLILEGPQKAMDRFHKDRE